MNFDTLKTICDRYIESWNSNPQFAIMLTGEWGCGKTYLAKKYINDRNENSDGLSWYISVFGVKKSEEIDGKLFEAAHPIISEKNNKRWLSVTYNVMRGAAKYKLGLDLKDIVNSLCSIFKDKKNISVSCQVLFVDDVERSLMNLKEMFGYFSQLVDNDTRVVFIANEKELIKKEEYKEIKDKIIGEIYNIEPDYEAAIKTFWNEFFGAKYTNLKEIFKFVSRRYFRNNLRIIRRVIHNTYLFVSNLPDEYKSDETYITEFFEELIVLLFCKENGNYDDLLSQNCIECCVEYSNIEKKMEKDWSKYVEEINKKTSSGKGNMKYYRTAQYVKYISRLIFENKYEDRDYIEQCLSTVYNMKKSIEKNVDENNRGLIKLRNIVFYDDKKCDIEKIFNGVVSEFHNGKYVRFDEIILYVQICLSLINGNIIPKEYDCLWLNNELINIRDNFREKIYGLPDIARTNKKNVMHVNDNEMQETIYELYDIAKQSVGDFEKDIFEKKEAFLLLINDPNKAITDFEDVKLLEKADIDKIFTWLGDDIENHKKLIKFLEYRYYKVISNRDLLKRDYQEVVYVKMLQEKIERLCNNIAHKYRMDYRDFIDVKVRYDELVEYMSKKSGFHIGE